MNGKENTRSYHAGEWYSWASLCGHGFLLLPGAQFLYFFTHAIEVISSTIATAVRVDGKMCDPHLACVCKKVHCLMNGAVLPPWFMWGPCQPQESLYHRMQCLMTIHTGYLGPIQLPERNRNLLIHSENLHSIHPEGPSLNERSCNLLKCR